ncbi:hypothetical protein JXA32_16780 [Candidatus Sumerlaeota bacterium]|nr:hypothetical protein [Candidatus Sumerlaeota bacterium]
MSPVIHKRVAACRRRLNWLNLLRKLVRAAQWGLIAGAVFMLLSRIAELGLAPYDWSGVAALLGAALAAGAIWAIATRIDNFQAAVAADQALGLKERISTACHYQEPRTPFEHAVLQDAEQVAGRIAPRRDFSLQLGRRPLWSIVPLALISALYFVNPIHLTKHNSSVQASPAQLILTQEQTKTIEKIEQAREKLEYDNERTASPEIKKISNELDELVKKFKEAKLTKPQAISELSNAKEKMENRRKELEKQLEKRTLKAQFGDSEHTGTLQKNLNKGKFQEAAFDMNELKNKMLKDVQSGRADEETLKKAANELNKIAESLGENSELGKAMQQAAQAMQNGDMDQMVKAMNDSIQQMQDMDTMLKDVQTMQNMENLLNMQKQSLLNAAGQQSNAMTQQAQQQGQQGQQVQGQPGKTGQPSQSGQQPGQSQSQQSQSGQAPQNNQSGDQGQSGEAQQSGQQEGGASAQGESSQSGANGSAGSGQSGNSQNNQTGAGNQRPNSQQQNNSTCPQCNGAGCSACNGTGQRQGTSSGMGAGSRQPSQSGMGGPGQGRGNVAPESDQQTTFQNEKLPQQMDEVGDIIAMYKVKGPQMKGDSIEKFKQITEVYEQQAEDTLNRDPIPADMKDFVGEYFDALRASDDETEE